MNREQVKELFQFIGSIYPSFIPDNQEKLTRKVDTWTRLMRKMDFERVMAKTEQHSLESKFHQTIADVAAYAPEKNEHLEKMRQWEKEAKKVPQHVKENFKKQLNQLLKDKAQ